MENLLQVMQELVVANRILATEGVCDAFESTVVDSNVSVPVGETGEEIGVDAP